MRRRELLAGLTGRAGALLLPLPGTPAGPGKDPLASNLEAILTGRSASAAPVSIPALRKSLTTAWQAFETCHYQALAGQLPDLVGAAAASRASATGPVWQAVSAILADTYVLASELALKANEDGIAWVAADSALPAARDSGDAAASRAVAMAMRRQGHYDGATAILSSTALTLGAGHGNPPPRVPCRLRITAVHRRLRLRPERAEVAGIRPDQRGQDSSRPDGEHTSRTERLLLSQRRGLPDQHPHRPGRLRGRPHPGPRRRSAGPAHPRAARTVLHRHRPGLAAARTPGPGIPGPPPRRTAIPRGDPAPIQLLPHHDLGQREGPVAVLAGEAGFRFGVQAFPPECPWSERPSHDCPAGSPSE